jgi:hypothetical protein
MCSDDGPHGAGCLVVALEEGCGGGDESVEAGEELAVRDLGAEVAPEHLDRVEPRAVGWQV